MRKRQPAALAKFAATVVACATFLQTSSARAAEQDLPPKAQAVAAKFALYRETATPAAVEVKRQQVIAYLGSLLNEEAAKANLEGALAVKALIAQLAAKPAAAGPIAPGANPQGAERKAISTRAGAAATEFSIRDLATRRLAFDFEVASAASVIRCEIGSAFDDSGDGGLCYELVDPSGKVAKRGFLNSLEEDVVIHEATARGWWRLWIIDADTDIAGENPGNGGSVRVEVLPGRGETIGGMGLATRGRGR